MIPFSILPGIARLRHALTDWNQRPSEVRRARETEPRATIVFKRKTRYKVSGA
jgi:hypothetical protein